MRSPAISEDLVTRLIPIVALRHRIFHIPGKDLDKEISLPFAMNTPVFVVFISPCPRQGLSLPKTGKFTVKGKEIHRLGEAKIPCGTSLCLLIFLAIVTHFTALPLPSFLTTLDGF
jgi:hypothetical protein